MWLIILGLQPESEDNGIRRKLRVVGIIDPLYTIRVIYPIDENFSCDELLELLRQQRMCLLNVAILDFSLKLKITTVKYFSDFSAQKKNCVIWCHDVRIAILKEKRVLSWQRVPFPFGTAVLDWEVHALKWKLYSNEEALPRFFPEQQNHLMAISLL